MAQSRQARSDVSIPLHLPPFRRLGLLCAFASGVFPAGSFAQSFTPADETPVATTQLRTADGVPTRKARQTPVLIAYLENDFFGGTDENYTNGFKLAWISPDLTPTSQQGPRARLLEWLPFLNAEGAQKNLGVALAQHIYTPQDIARNNPDPTDRPYAGWTYFEFSFLAKTDRRADTVAIQLGLIGPHSFADDVQIGFHELINAPSPNGWNYQLRDEPGLNIAWERKWRSYARSVSAADRLGLRTSPFSGRASENRLYWGIDFIPHLGAVVGNVSTYANAGVTVRFGHNIPSDFGVNLMRPAGVASSPIDDLDPRTRGSGWSFYGFVGVDGRAIARDIFLDGNTFTDSRSVEKKPFVADISYGVGLIKGRFQGTFTRVIRTKEFETQRNDRSEFGSVSTTWTF